jgi:hypothetical protein
MITRRQFALLAAGLACLCLACFCHAWPASRLAGRAAGRVRLDDKPSGPVAVSLELAPPSAAGQVVHATLKPVRDLASVQWRWDLSPGVALLQGALTGEADPGAGASSSADIVLLPPAGNAWADATLVTEATFAGADQSGPTGTETTVQCSAVQWGESDPGAVTLVPAMDPDTGEATSVALVPSQQRPGR